MHSLKKKLDEIHAMRKQLRDTELRLDKLETSLRGVVSHADAIEVLITTICNKLMVSRDDIFSKRRPVPICIAKNTISYVAREVLPEMTLTQLGAYLRMPSGPKHHTTIMYQCRAAQNQIDIDPRYRDWVNELIEQTKQLIHESERNNLRCAGS